mgnify:CR=1 FL=1
MNKEFKLSVHQLVDFLLRVGDIDNRVFNKATMNEGSRLHAYYQMKMGEFYISEYYLKEESNVVVSETKIDKEFPSVDAGRKEIDFDGLF